jgi:hypothetical protein
MASALRIKIPPVRSLHLPRCRGLCRVGDDSRCLDKLTRIHQRRHGGLCVRITISKSVAFAASKGVKLEIILFISITLRAGGPGKKRMKTGASGMDSQTCEIVPQVVD